MATWTDECGKIGYPSKGKALDSLGSLKSRRKGRKKRVKSESGAYQCRDCGMWHTTSISLP